MQEVLDFLAELAENNEKSWFEANKKRYQHALGHVSDVVQELILRVGTFEALGSLSAKECLFRIYRDVRFSPNKVPYKINMGAVIAPGGRRSSAPCYYVHIQPHGESFLAGGLYAPMAAQLHNVRQVIAEDARPFRAVLADEGFAHYFGTLAGDKVKTAPRGYKKDHPNIDLLRYKNYVAIHRLADAQVTADDFLENTVTIFRQLKPFNDLLKQMQSD